MGDSVILFVFQRWLMIYKNIILLFLNAPGWYERGGWTVEGKLKLRQFVPRISPASLGVELLSCYLQVIYCCAVLVPLSLSSSYLKWERHPARPPLPFSLTARTYIHRQTISVFLWSCSGGGAFCSTDAEKKKHRCMS